MTRVLVFSVFLWATAAAGQSVRERIPVLVELFTSEGCSSCPVADEALARLAATQPISGVEIVPLGFHVDYWNQLGWADPFSSAAFSARQGDYAGGSGPYTPQMIVDGTRGFVGELARTRDEVTRAANSPKGRARLTLAGTEPLHATLLLEGLPDAHAAAEVWLAVTEDGLESRVQRGENAGRTLHHAAVVRTLRRVGNATAGAQDVPLTLAASWRRDHVRVVAWVQEVRSRRVLAVATASPP
jgi:hypothetical protein